MNSTPSIASNINKHCLCKTLDADSLKSELSKNIDYDSAIAGRPNLFSQTSVYISVEDLRKVTEFSKSIEAVINSEAFRAKVLDYAPDIAKRPAASKGVFVGLDFHFTNDGPRLIEINTNAGGAYLNLVLANAQLACCEGVKTPFQLSQVEQSFIDMFVSEWRSSGNEGSPKTIAIVDSRPEDQFLFPEFQLVAASFRKHGIDCFILDPKDLRSETGGLFYREVRIDLVYNRLTDFYFDQPENEVLREAYVSGKTVVTPNPYHHALYANKRNLEVLTDEDLLLQMGIEPSLISKFFLNIPKTMMVTEANKEVLWKERKNYFFKTTQGYGSKAVYRGDKITKRVWEHIINSDYIAQELIPPGQRVVMVNDEQVELKADLRAYTFDGKIQLLAARLYAGQTTNFRTAGGGFAPVFLI